METIHSITKISKNIQESFEDLRRLAVTMILVKDYQLKLAKKKTLLGLFSITIISLFVTFLHQRQLVVFNWNLRNSMYPQVSRILLNILNKKNWPQYCRD